MIKMTLEEKYAYNKAYYDANKLKVQAQRRERKNTDVRGRMMALLNNARARASREGWEFNLTCDYLVALWEEQRGLCAITGEPMSISKTENRIRSNLVSLDRIDSDKFYTQDNVWLTTSKVNYAKGPLSNSEFIEMCRKVIQHHD